jgi:PucR C-terminal helix-turn-helix domain/GGDEF-like domain
VNRRGLHSITPRSFEEVCATIVPRLRARFSEMEENLAHLIEADPDSREVDDPIYLDYLDSLPANRAAVLEYGLAVIELGERRAVDVPSSALTAARLAARAGIPLETILRRYSAGNAFFGDILVEEAERVEASPAALRRLLHRQTTIFDRLHKAVSEEYAREVGNRPMTTAEWRHAYIEELLAGRQPDDAAELGYDLDGHHLGLMAKGDRADEAVRELAKGLDRRLLVDRCGEEPLWACWLGGGRPLETEEALRALDDVLSDSVIALGEPGEGISGWRLSHRQAKAALPIAERRGRSALRYADVAVLAAILRDDLGRTSLRQLYLEPLERSRDGGKVSRETLRAYFARHRNVSSTAATLGVDRRTVTNRLRAVEELFGCPLEDIATDLEIALRIAE